jgi:hypothetical protein
LNLASRLPLKEYRHRSFEREKKEAEEEEDEVEVENIFKYMDHHLSKENRLEKKREQ